MTATYIKHGRGKSLNAIFAEECGTLTGSAWAKRLGRGIQAGDIAAAIPRGEWHHTGKHASRTPYYSQEEIEEGMAAILAARDARMASKAEPFQQRIHTIVWQEFKQFRGRYGRTVWDRQEFTFIGPATIKGDWVHFDGRKMSLSGKNLLSLTHLEEAK